jgi:hypothetical protein
VPVYINNGIAKIKIQPRFQSGTIGVAEFYNLDLISRVSEIGSCNFDEQTRSFSFVGENSDIVLGTVDLVAYPVYWNKPSVFSIFPGSDVYRSLQNGIMLLPGVQDTQMSMVLNPQNVHRYCQAGSLLYRTGIDGRFEITVKSLIGRNEQVQEPNDVEPIQRNNMTVYQTAYLMN